MTGQTPIIFAIRNTYSWLGTTSGRLSMSRANSDRTVATGRLGARLALKGITSAVMVVVAPLASDFCPIARRRAIKESAPCVRQFARDVWCGRHYRRRIGRRGWWRPHGRQYGFRHRSVANDWGRIGRRWRRHGVRGGLGCGRRRARRHGGVRPSYERPEASGQYDGRRGV